jgi:hypothetical protein
MPFLLLPAITAALLILDVFMVCMAIMAELIARAPELPGRD